MKYRSNLNYRTLLFLHPSLASFVFLLFFSKHTVAQPVSSYHYPKGTDTIYHNHQMIVRNLTKDTLEIASFKNGKKNGKQTLFFTDGTINRLANYKDDLLSGKVEYYSQGQKKPIRFEHYKAFPKEQLSLLHGRYKVFGWAGELLEDINYKNGLKNGTYQLYHNTTKLKEKGTFEDHLNIDKKRYYSPDGTLLKDENYIIIDNPKFVQLPTKSEPLSTYKKEIRKEPKKLSVLNGKVKYYYSNGFISSDFTYKNGNKDGLCKEFFPDKNDALKSEVVFKDGLEHGAFTYYRNDRTIERKGIYYREITSRDTVYKNVYDGTIDIYQDNGKRSRIERWKHFKKNGLQESFYYKTGELSERFQMIDNLKTGIEERFDKDANRTYLAHFEIIEKNGQHISQQIGTETYWDNNQITNIVEWKNGKHDGTTKSYYPNGQLEKLMHFKDGKLHGTYKTYYDNGQLKEDFNKQYWVGTGNPETIGWNSTYDASGQLERHFFALGNTKNIIEHSFKNGKRKSLIAHNILNLSFSPTYQLSAIHWLNNGYPTFGYDLFSDQQLRKTHFQVNKLAPVSANFTSQGELIQVTSQTGAVINDETINAIAQKVAKQYNPNWATEVLSTQNFPDGPYQWNYADGTPFFKIEFKDNLPQGSWISYNPIRQDTLFYGEFHKGLPVGKHVNKNIDGTPEVRQEYYPNHNIKEIHQYGDTGKISHISKKDSTGIELYYEEYYPNGQLKEKRVPKENSYINFTITGDTLSYNLLFTKHDSIRIERQFFEGNKLKVDRYNNITTGIGSVKTYFEHGQLQTSHDLKNKITEGVYQKFDAEGNLVVLGHFKAGKRDGKWINYKNGNEDISIFKDGEIQIPETTDLDNSDCKCYDTSLAGSKIGFANLLKHFAEYTAIKPFTPKSISPIDDWHYDNIFYINLRTHNDRTSGSSYFKLLLFNDFSFHYPTTNHLKFNINPCKTEGYLGNIEANVSYNFDQKELMYSELKTKRIAVSLEKNPLVDAKDNTAFTAYFDTDYMTFDAHGIQSIKFTNTLENCYSLGLINNFMSVQVESAHLEIQPKNKLTTSDLPLLATEIRQFYGLEIDAATVTFNIDSVEINATCEKIRAGAHYVAGKIWIDGRLQNENLFILNDSKKSINLLHLRKVLEDKGFYRVKTEVFHDKLVIEFYTEH